MTRADIERYISSLESARRSLDREETADAFNRIAAQLDDCYRELNRLRAALADNQTEGDTDHA